MCVCIVVVPGFGMVQYGRGSDFKDIDDPLNVVFIIVTHRHPIVRMIWGNFSIKLLLPNRLVSLVYGILCRNWQ